MANTDPAKLHDDAVIIDAVCPLLMEKEYVDWYIEGGLTTIAPTVGGFDPTIQTLKTLGAWLEFIKNRDDLILVRKASDVVDAKKQGKLGIVLHFQGTEPIEDSVDLVNVYKTLGVGIIQLAYNVKNRIGDGAQERTDCGLSHFGVNFIKRCNEQRVIVDCSHTGYRTTMEAIELSEQPVVFSHANSKAVYASQRNIQDDQIKAVADTGGVVGIVGFPAFVSDSPRPTLDQFIAHIDHTAEVAGIDHVALGIDYYTGQDPVVDPVTAKAKYDKTIAAGRWRSDAYPPPPHYYPEGIETPRTLSALTARLLERGYSETDVRKILGENWLRVYRDVWGD
ncbi:dipeptidase [Thalassospiraceae bacterium LMO-JJ14]|nr:dipeptidase [Thalassospiraceae bacterium LMO-JJ14]